MRRTFTFTASGPETDGSAASSACIRSPTRRSVSGAGSAADAAMCALTVVNPSDRSMSTSTSGCRRSSFTASASAAASTIGWAG